MPEQTASRVYIESSVISYLAARPSRDLVAAARQAMTEQWWTRRRYAFELCISELVLDEISRGDAEQASARKAIVGALPVLEVDPQAIELGEKLIENTPMPARAVADALHVATATVNGADFLLTWNFRHLANADLAWRFYDYLWTCDLVPPIICTPEELLEESP